MDHGSGKTATVNEMLYEKLSVENEVFLDSLMKMQPKELIKNSYEIVIKADILMVFEEGNALGDMDENKATALLSCDSPLDYLYQEWFASECSHIEILCDFIDDSASDLAEGYQKAE